MRIVVEEGAQRGAVFELGPLTVLGRGEDCELQLLDAGVSRRHAELRRVTRTADSSAPTPEALELRDLGSHNGTLLNGLPVEQALLGSGDRITLGGVRLLVLQPAQDAGSGAQPGRPTRELTLEEGQPELSDLRPGEDPERLLGESAPVRELLRLVARVAPARAPVLIHGETGTGKELVARALHAGSPRRSGPLVIVNCAALPRELVESELFGHERGAFTGALARKLGLAEAAHRGTLFLDELGELDLAAQAKLLRFVERGEVQRVGASAPRRVDARLVAATHRDLGAEVAAGRFREDLLHRLRVLELRVPPLRERGDDLLLLARAFLRRFAGQRLRFSPACERALTAWAWPGNVRELRNAIEAASILAAGPEVSPADLPERLRERAPLVGSEREDADDLSLRSAERRAILRALERCGGHRTRTAEALGIDRKTLYARLKELGIEGA